MSTKKRSKKSRYVVRYRSTTYTDVEVSARNKDDAIDKADAILDRGDTEGVDAIDNDDMEVVTVNEVIDA